MPGDIIYAAEKASKVRANMVLGEGTLRERFHTAYTDEGVCLQPRGETPTPMTEELAQAIEEFAERVSLMPALRDEGTLTSTLSFMDDNEIRGLVMDFLGLTAWIEREYFELLYGGSSS